MSKRVTTKLHRWRVIRLKATPAAPIDTVEAPDRETAIKEAIRKFDILQTTSRS